jgi:cyclophilin family peptidyl-prolyl cis-trans isomerase
MKKWILIVGSLFLVGLVVFTLQKKRNPGIPTSFESKGTETMMVIETTYGPIEIDFFPADAPNTVTRIKELVSSGFYDGLKFHRVVPGFVVQGGDPQGNGTGGSGKNLQAEFNSRPHVEGTLAMARAADPNSADSQFYISLGRHPHLDNNYTVFGQVKTGMDFVKQIKQGDKMIKVTLKNAAH